MLILSRGLGGLVVLGALLSACGGQAPSQGGTPVPGGPPCLVTSPTGLPGGGLVAQGLPASALTAHWNAPRVPGEVLITSPGGALSPQALGALSGVRTQAVGEHLKVAFTPQGETDEAFAARLAAAGLRAQPNYRYEALGKPNDPGYPGGTAEQGYPGITVGGVAYDQDYLNRIDAQGAWDYLQSSGASKCGAVKVAVLDTGANKDHEELQGRIVQGTDFCSGLDANDNCAGTDPDYSEVTEGGNIGHGTSSAGLIGAATNNGKGIASVTWSGSGTAMLSQLVIVKVFGANATASGATTESVVRGLDYARGAGAKVINMSLGFVGGADPALSDAIGRAAQADIVMVAAAGNTPDQGLYYPASDPRVLAVGALGKTEDLACYSARPKSGQKALDLVAPGGNAGSGTANCLQQSGDDILTLFVNGYTLEAGTSVAAPQVAGVAALVRAVNPKLSAQQVGALLKASAKTVSGGRLVDAGAAVRAAAR